MIMIIREKSINFVFKKSKYRQIAEKSTQNALKNALKRQISKTSKRQKICEI